MKPVSVDVLSARFKTYRGPTPLTGTTLGYVRGAATHIAVAVFWQAGMLLNVFNVLQVP